MFTIGEFSKITGLTIKALRFYHDVGLLVPAWIDERTGYRHYDAQQIEKARVISALKTLGFTLEQIGLIFKQGGDETDVLAFLEAQRARLLQIIHEQREAIRKLDQILQQEREARMATKNATYQVEEKELERQLIAGVRMRGRYQDCGQGFSRIGRAMGRHICGPALLLHYDQEYKEDDADFEACMPVRTEKKVEGVLVRELPGGRAVTLVHQGPYSDLGRSYEKILAYVKQKGYEIDTPTREIYLKGPGMIFKGNPKKYLTEIQMLIRG